MVNVASAELLYYLTIGLILYYIFREMLSLAEKNGGKWLIIFGVFLVILAIWAYYSSLNKEDCWPELNDCGDTPCPYSKPGCGPGCKKEDGTHDSNCMKCEEGEKGEDKINFIIQSDYETQDRELCFDNEPVLETNQITYVNFKKWYLTDDFINKYTQSLKMACRIKKIRLFEARKQFVEDLKTLKSKSPQQEGIIAQLLDKNDDTKLIETTIVELTELYKEVTEKEKLIDAAYSRKCLISALTDKKKGIDSLTGRDEVKDFLALRLYTFAENPRTFFSGFQNIELDGSAGVGKTKVAQVIGHVYSCSGLLTRNHVHTVTKQAFTTAYVNESARMTRKVLLSNLEGVVFIDEAYDFTPESNGLYKNIDHGSEAITEMVNFIDKMKGLSLIIVAGYPQQMIDRFRSANEGIPRRFPFQLLLDSYSSKELTNICISFMLESCTHINFTDDHGNILFTYIDYVYSRDPEVFKAQAGDMNTLSGYIERAIYGSPGKTWDKDAEDLILSGLNSYLVPKNVSIRKNILR